MNSSKSPSAYKYNCNLVELYKGEQKIRPINMGNRILPVEKVYEIEDTYSNPEKTIILPDLNCYVIYTELLSGERKVFFVGPRSNAIEIKRSIRLKTIITQLPPSGSSIKNSPSFQELINTTTSMSTLFGSTVEEQLIHLFNSWSNNEKETLHTMEFSFERLNSKKNLDHHVNHFITKASVPHVQELAKDIGVSQRHLRSLFYKHYGMPPKTVLKIKRLYQSLRACTTTSKYAQIALESGYFDQSHMISEYQSLIGKTPKQLFG